MLKAPDIDDHTFRDLSRLVFESTGIEVPPTKRDLIASRLAKRLRALSLQGYRAYYERIVTATPEDPERRAFINSVTTNKTSFFREAHHFDFLRQVLVPRWRRRAAAGGARRLRVWSAACSTGEEAYSIAMTLLDALGPEAGTWDIKILGSDVDTDVLAHAQAGVYDATALQDVPAPMQKRFLLRGLGPQERSIRIKPEVQAVTIFRHLNLIDANWPLQKKMDAIFCRNVFIYFNRQTQHTICHHFARCLADDGALVLGHAEGLAAPADRFDREDVTVYRLLRQTDASTHSETRS